MPVTPDVPAIRAAVQLRDVAVGLGCRERLAMVINRANSGVTVADMERTVGMPALALIRSGGLLFVRAANEGRTVIEMFPKEKITADFDLLADRVLGRPASQPRRPRPASGSGPRAPRPRPRLKRHASRERDRARLAGAIGPVHRRPATRPAASRGARPSARRPARPRADRRG